MASLKGIPTKCRFAVLDVSDDGDEEKSGVGENVGNAKKADANNATKAKKKRKKKKNKAKNEQVAATWIENLLARWVRNCAL